MKLGYSTWGLPTLPLESAIAQLARLGFEGIEIVVLRCYDTTMEQWEGARRRQLAELLRAHARARSATEREAMAALLQDVA